MTAGSLPLLSVDGLCAGYGRVPVLWGVSFDVPEGQIVALVGANGAGKTTTLRTLSGLLPATGGSIRFDGQDLATLRSDQIVDLGVIHVPEGSQLWPGLTVEENLELGAYLPRPGARLRESLDRVYTLFPHLKDRRGQRAGTLSGGERQMCAIARGLTGLPRLLMLDEPSLGLAPRIASEMFRAIHQLGREGTTVLLVEQNVSRALRLASHAYVLELGRIVLSGPGRTLLADPHVREAYLGT
jgi:branched-chain amino acid transport system ATP-binding protein